MCSYGEGNLHIYDMMQDNLSHATGLSGSNQSLHLKFLYKQPFKSETDDQTSLLTLTAPLDIGVLSHYRMQLFTWMDEPHHTQTLKNSNYRNTLTAKTINHCIICKWSRFSCNIDCYWY